MSIKRHTLLNIIGKTVPLIVMLVTVPIYLQLIGEERYGVLAIAWLLLGYFGLFDLGLSRATAQRIAALRTAQAEDRSIVFWTALILNTSFGIVGALLLWPIAYVFFGSYFQVSEELRSEMLMAVPWIAASLPIATISGVMVGALQGREQFLSLNLITVLGSVLLQGLPLLVAWLHVPDLAWLVPAALLARISTFTLLFTQCRRHVPVNGWPSFQRTLAGSLFKYGGWVTVTGIIGPLLSTLDRFLIGMISGARAVAYYTVPFNLVSRITIVPLSLSNALFPRFSVAQIDERNHLIDEAVRALAITITPIVVMVILIIDPFLGWWINRDFASNAARVGEIIAIGLWFNSLATIPFASLQAQGRPDLVAKCHIAELLPYLGLLWIALHLWGTVGAALAWSVRVAVDAVLLFWMSGAMPRIFAHVTPGLSLLLIAAIAVIGFAQDSAYRWLLGGGAMLGCIAWYWAAAPTSLRQLLTGFLMRLRPRNA